MEEDVTRNIREQLSAFLDGELPEAELELLVRRLERDEEHRATLARYAAVGSVLRRDPLPTASLRLHDGLRAAIAEERDQAAQPGSKGGGAYGSLLAAAAAGLVLAGLLVLNPFAERPADALSDIAATNLAAAQQAPAERTERESASRAVASRARLSPERMTSYLVSHGEYARSFQGAMVDSRIFVQQASFEE